MPNIVLIGYRGTGKTAVGKQIAERLNRKLIEMDRLISEKAGMSIPEIIETYGWNRFRDIESEVAETVSKLHNCVIDTGGGVILRSENIENLKKEGIIILLKADIPAIIDRIKDNNQRPSLTRNKSFVDEVGDVLKQRTPRYEDTAEFCIDTSKLTLDETVIRILRYLKTKNVLKKP
jgi:shikimate kinase